MRLLRGCFWGLLALGVSACSLPLKQVVSKQNTAPLPEMNMFQTAPQVRAMARSNTDIFNEFLDLTFALESGQNIARLSRFEGPVTVSLRNALNGIVGRDLDLLLGRFRAEAGIAIRRVPAQSDANIIIEMIPKRMLYRAAPNAACIVVPRVSSWTEFRRNRFNRLADWTSVEERTRAAVFMPNDISPQDARDCLHEELAQALGPLNDLYRLPDSVYNDDNFHIVLTDYDMMILRAFFAPELHSGMAKHEVAAVLPRILARVNPRGIGLAPMRLQETPREWTRRIETALGAKGSTAARIAAATQAIAIAKREGITDHRLGFSYFARARVSAHQMPQKAAADFARAYGNFVQFFGPYDIHTAQVALQMASLSFSSGDFKSALGYIEPSLIGAKAGQNAQLLFSLLAMKSEIYKLAGRAEDAAALRKEAIAWGQYGVYPLSEIKQRLKLIEKLAPQAAKAES